MRNLNEYDFSKGSGFKDALLKKCLTQLSDTPAGQISDDDLEFVAAAGTNASGTACPWPRRPCGNCLYTVSVTNKECSLGHHK